jgi:hypothetical protein
MTSLTIHCARGPRTIDDVDAKLAWRASLPGASTYDRAAHVLRALQADGAHAADLLPLALPASWMVNAKATSRAMQRWLEPASLDRWRRVFDVLAFDLSPQCWLAKRGEEREACAAAVASLATGGEGATLGAVTKVLALLRPPIVPIMSDAALAFALDLVPRPEVDDAAEAPPSAFLPMLDWFAREVLANEEALVAIASRHRDAVLDAAQTLDRLVYVASRAR